MRHGRGKRANGGIKEPHVDVPVIATKVIRLENKVFVCVEDMALFTRREYERTLRMASNSEQFKEFVAGKMAIIDELLEASRSIYDVVSQSPNR